ncbi:hypothetical protein PACTADRAFT_67037 [Pachysolen tannophilus NRRL Y-2460]|uniref:Dystroglycan-type cadherin-like domain-containing protein n=1 Tax=Pachysolen tannophilus NRRL Y-2460 TaxID=669874 RepID=A0A1E4TW75_PACTA|nr:hypothetical protein PACTADRAFT_67037 [Pachysolen tannophilus NRRL Y-2460]
MKINNFSYLPTIALLYLNSLLVIATPYVGFPFDEQLPLVARTEESYSFTISNETFLSNDSTVTFDASDLPSWLSFDSSSRTFLGTPSTSDATDNLTITLIGYDSTGNISEDYTLVVSTDPAPELKSSDIIFTELSSFGDTNGYDGLVLAPGQTFNLNFSMSIFEVPSDSSNSIVAYYGRSSDATPLPSWIQFDSDTLTFSGTAPAVNSDIAPSFEYGFLLIATDYVDFSGCIGTFKLIVGAHQLSTSLSSTIVLNGTVDETVNYTLPLSDVYLDGKEISSSNISSLTLEGAPSWLSLDEEFLSGTIPDTADDDEVDYFNITIEDVFGNTIAIQFKLDVEDSLFTVSDLSDVNATRGEYFEYTLPKTDFTDLNNTDLSASFDGNETSWLDFHTSNLTFTGSTPTDLDSLEVEITATRGSLTDSLSFEISGVAKSKTSSSPSASSSSAATSSQSSSKTSSATATTGNSSSTTAAGNLDSSKSASSNKKKTVAIAVGVVVPVVTLTIIALVFYFCYWKRRRDSDADQEKSPKSISGPILGNPSNNPNNRSATRSITDVEDDADEDAKRLSALNVLNLEKLDYGSESDESGSTNIEDSSIYQDAMQTYSSDLSWRRNDELWKSRNSLNSIATVATNELYSVRVVDDDFKRKSQQSNILAYRKSGDMLGSTTSSVLTKDSGSGNFQRLDSDNNVISMNNPKSENSLVEPRIVDNNSNYNNRSSSRYFQAPKNLDILHEEHHPRSLGPEHFSLQDNYYNSNGASKNDIGHSTSANDMSTSTSTNAFSSDGTSIGDEFRPTQTSNGDLRWDHVNENTFSATANRTGTEEGGFNFESPANASLRNASNPDTIHNNSTTNINTTSESWADSSRYTDLSGGISAISTTAKARLVEFSHRGRTSSHEPNFGDDRVSNEGEIENADN